LKVIVLPGQKVADTAQPGQGVFIEDNKTYASTLAVLRDGRVIPQKGQYKPLVEDFVVGLVKDVQFNGYHVDVNAPFESFISNRETLEEFKAGEVVSAKVVEVNELHEATLSQPRKFPPGTVIEISFVKVPRVIGRNGSMLDMIKAATGAEIFVGKNGRVFLTGGNITLAIKAIRKIDAEAHTQGLTDAVKEFLEKNKENDV